MKVMSMMVAITAISSPASPTSDKSVLSSNQQVPSFPLNVDTDRDLSVSEVNAYITNKIKSMQNIKNVNILQTQLTTNLQLTYGNQINWLVFVAQDFKPSQENVSINYFGKGITSNVIVGSWTVYWAATRRCTVAPADVRGMVVNQDIINSQLSSCFSTVKGQFTASMVYECLETSPTPVTSGGNLIAKFIFIFSSPGPNTSVGNSQELNLFKQNRPFFNGDLGMLLVIGNGQGCAKLAGSSGLAPSAASLSRVLSSRFLTY